MATLTSLGFSIFSTYNGRGVRDASSDIRGLNNTLNQTTGGLNSFTGRLGVLITTAAALGPALVPIGAGVAAVGGGLVAATAAAGAAAGVFGGALFGSIKQLTGTGGLLTLKNNLDEQKKKLAELTPGTAAYAAQLKVVQAAQEQYTNALRQASPAQQAFIAATDKMKASYSEFLKSTEGSTLPAATIVINAMAGGLNKLVPIVRAVAPLALGVANAFQKWVDTRLDGWVAFIVTNGVPALQNFITIAKNLATVVGDLVRAFAPMGVAVTAELAKLSAQLAAWADGGGFQRFLQYVNDNAPNIKGLFVALGQALQVLLQAIIQMGPVALSLTMTILNLIGALNPTLVQVAIQAWVAYRLAVMALQGVAVVVTVIQTLSAAIGAARLAAVAFEISLAPMLAIIGLVILIVAALGVAIFLLVTHWREFSDFVSTVFMAAVQAVWTFLQAVGAWIMNVFANVWAGVQIAWTAVWNALQLAATTVWTALQVAWQAVVTSFATAWTATAAALTAAWNATWNALSIAARAVWTALQAAWSAFINTLNSIWNSVSAALRASWSAFWSALTAAWNAFRSAMQAAWSAFWGAMTAAWNAFKGAMQAAWSAFWSALTAAWNAFRAAIQAAWSAFWAALTAAWNSFRAAIQAAWGAFWAALTSAWNAFRAAIQAAWTALWNAMHAAFNTFKAAVQAAWQAFWNALMAAWNTFKNAITSAWSALWNALKSAAQSIWKQIGDIIAKAINGISGIINKIIDGFNGIAKAVGISLSIPKIPTVSINFAYGGIVGEVPFAKGGNVGLGGGKGTARGLQHRGGVLSGYAPGRDTVPAILSRGEGVLVPEAVRGLGPNFVHWANHHFSGGRAGKANAYPGFAKGGMVAFNRTGGMEGWGSRYQGGGVVVPPGTPGTGQGGGTAAGATPPRNPNGSTATSGSGTPLPNPGDIIKGILGAATGLSGIGGMVLGFIGREAIEKAFDFAFKMVEGFNEGGQMGKVFVAIVKKIIKGMIDFIVKKDDEAKKAFESMAVASSQSVQAWAPLAAKALALAGLNPNQLPRFLALMQAESGGNPNAINRTDINAKNGVPSQGLMQVIPPTFTAYHVAGTSNNILDPLANMAAAANYIKHRYGGSVPGSPYGNGTSGANKGWHMVGEFGPEWVKFRGGERVKTNRETRDWGHGGGGAQFHAGAFQFAFHGSVTRDALQYAEGDMCDKLRMAVQAGVGRRGN